MLVCSTCGRPNSPSAFACAGCGANLPGGAADDLARALAAEQAARRRSRQIYGLVGVVVVGLLAAYAVRDRLQKAAVGEKLAWLDAWAEKDKQEVGALWNCLTQSNTPLESFSNANQVQAKVEAAAMVQPKTFAQHLRVECVPGGERLITSVEALPAAPAEFATAFAAYKAALPKLNDGVATYADRLDTRVAGADLSSRIQTAGGEWHASESPTAESIAFERFLQCAVPGIGKLKDAQGLLEALARECYKKDAVAFWQSVQDKCAVLLMQPDPLAKPSPSYKASVKKFYEPEQRMMSAWEDCARRGVKGGRDNDLAQFLAAFGEYMEARALMGRAAKALGEGA